MKENALVVQGSMISRGIGKTILWLPFWFFFPVWDYCFLGLGGRCTGVLKWFVLLARGRLIIPVTTGGDLRKLRSEGKTVPSLCKEIILCWK